MASVVRVDDPNSPEATAYTTAFLTGVALHQCLFRHGEWDNWSFIILIIFGAAQAGLFLFFHQYQSELAAKAFKHASYFLAANVSGIWTSMLMYRAFFHRLNAFPGPFLARLSAFYMTGVSIKSFQVYKDVRKLHQKYGDIVRVGPTELSIADPKAFGAIYSSTSPCMRGPWYNVLNPTISLQMVRDNKEHARRRKAWDKAFSVHAIRDYQARVNTYTDDLLSIIHQHATSSSPNHKLDASKWFHFYSFDVMGDLAFGKPFAMLKDGIEHFFFKSTHANMVLIGAFSRIVWLFPVFKAIPGLNYEYLTFQSWVRTHVKKRIANAPHVPDVFHWIIGDYQAKETKPSWQDTENLYGDAGLIVVAGSDTTAASLTCLFYHLALYPELYRKLQDEVDEFMADKGDALPDTDNNELAKLRYLQACVDESLRLYPAVPSGLQRQTPPQGLKIDDKTWIPGDVIVQMPSYTLWRDPRTFPRGDEFIPERWTSRPELVKPAGSSVYTPFSVGRFSCVGKQLGLMEIRRVTCLIAHRYDVCFAEGQTPEKFDGDIKDCFTMACGELNLVFTPRTK